MRQPLHDLPQILGQAKLDGNKHGYYRVRMANNVAFLATDVGRLFRKRFNVAARQIGVTDAQWRMLAAIRRTPGINQAAIANWLEVEAITAGRMIDRLEKAGLVERHADPCDRRTWHLHLTAQADCQMERLTDFAAVVFDEALAGFSDHERDTLLALLERVRGNLSEHIADDVLPELESMAHG